MGYYRDQVEKAIAGLRAVSASTAGSFDSAMNVGFRFQSLITDFLRSKDREDLSEILLLLLEGIQDEEPFVRDHLAYGIINIGEDAVPRLIEALRDHRKHVRKCAAGVLRAITHKRFLLGSQAPEKWERWWRENKGKTASKR